MDWRLAILGVFYLIIPIDLASCAEGIRFQTKEFLMHEKEALEVNVTVEFLDVINTSTEDSRLEILSTLEFRSDDSTVADVLIDEIEFWFWNESTVDVQLTLKANYIGRTNVRVGDKQEDVALKVVVLRSPVMATLNHVFSLTIFGLVATNLFFMGLQLDWQLMLGTLKKPFAPAIGFLCQYLLMPLLATAWAMAFLNGHPNLQLGYFAVGCAPGGGMSNFWTLLLDGNLDLSVTMTFCSNVAALAMMPFWIYTLGRLFYSHEDAVVSIPFLNITISLLLLIAPVFAGLAVVHFRPKYAEKSKRMIKVSTLAVLVTAVVLGSISNAYIFHLITWRTIVCGFLLPWSGFAVSYAIAALLKQDSRNCRTIGIEVMIQNAGVVIVLLYASLKPPESDLTMVMPICVIILTPFPLALALLIKTVIDCRRKRRQLRRQFNDLKRARRIGDQQSKPSIYAEGQQEPSEINGLMTPTPEVAARAGDLEKSGRESVM